MDDLLALDGGHLATAWRKRHVKRLNTLERNRLNRAKHDQRISEWEREQLRKQRLAKFDELARQKKLRRKKLRAKIAREDRQAFLKRRKAEGYRKPRLPYKDLTGRKFGRLRVIRPAGHNLSGSKRWWVKCDCGSRIKEVAGTNLQQGILRSCGCLKRAQALKAAARRNSAKAKALRRQIRGQICKWAGVFGGGAGDAKLLKRLRAVVDWGEAQIATTPKPRLRSLPTMAQVRKRANSTRKK